MGDDRPGGLSRLAVWRPAPGRTRFADAHALTRLPCRVLLLAFALDASSLAAQTEPYRPVYHFTPARNWMNDPNGLVWSGGEWHLFYQYNPFGDTWGHMSWGHAVSRDLMRWSHLPVAIPEENGIMAFSGSAVVDHGNTSGLGARDRPPMVAIFTGHRDGRQDQRLAWSADSGRTWTRLPRRCSTWAWPTSATPRCSGTPLGSIG